jgi:hypothetical protein
VGYIWAATAKARSGRKPITSPSENEHRSFWFLAGPVRVFGRVKTRVFERRGCSPKLAY